MQAKQTDKRSGRRYRKIRDDYIARCKALNAGCWLQPLGHCVFDGAPIDYISPGRNPRSPELHHKRPVATHPWLVYEPSNFAVGHARCNQVLGKKDPMVRAQVSNSVMHKPMHRNAGSCIGGWATTDW